MPFAIGDVAPLGGIVEADPGDEGERLAALEHVA